MELIRRGEVGVRLCGGGTAAMRDSNGGDAYWRVAGKERGSEGVGRLTRKRAMVVWWFVARQ